MTMRFFYIFCFFSLVFGLAACSTPAPGITPPATFSASQAVDSPTATQTVAASQPSVAPTDTPAPQPRLALAIFPAGPGEAFASQIMSAWQTASATSGLEWRRRETLSASDLVPGMRLALVFPGGAASVDALAQLASSTPQTQFVAFDFPGLQPTANLTVVGPIRYDQQGFLAGAVAALVTEDWRVAVISVGGSLAGKAARNGFLNGATYYCGLCNPFHGPIVDYPLYLELPAEASAAEWTAGAKTLVDQAVKTVYIAPGAAKPEMLTFLASNGVMLVGGEPLNPGLEKNTLLNILPDTQPVLDLLPGLLAGKSGGSLAIGFKFDALNPVFSAGRQRNANQFLEDLQAGFIDTGIDPQTGENR